MNTLTASPSVRRLLASHARMLADLDDVIAHALRVRTEWATDMPHLFAVPAGRRSTDTPYPTADGLTVLDLPDMPKGITCTPTEPAEPQPR